MSKWHKVETELPEKEGRYLCIIQYYSDFQEYLVLTFTTNAYNVDKHDFWEYKGKHKALFYEYDSEYGYFERHPIAWCEIPKYTEEKETKWELEEAHDNEVYKKGYNKAIDEFQEWLKTQIVGVDNNTKEVLVVKDDKWELAIDMFKEDKND